MVGDFDTPRHVQRISICCEGLVHAESHSLESGAWYSRMHASMVFLVLALHVREGHQYVFLSRFLPTQTTSVKQPTGL